ncbi:hypothetical protein NRB20_74750 [Nocardia sp. RB20]|uniref:Uncharacterized protein n=1 Tax=Nocardia macrotermitis TaxID=2585198 RepID=A0A7K0DEX1_9NOCA|nr:hypothetical protein [Nocardia macrotermitis]
MTECHLSVWFDDGEPLHFRAERSVAENFATAAAYLVKTCIDDQVQPWMPVMPYQELWC